MNVNTDITPYLFFGGRCEEAHAHYATALGGQTEMVMRFKESPEAAPEGMLADGFEDKVMHSSFRTNSGSTLFMADGCTPEDISKVSLHYPVADKAEGDRLFNALAEGGEVVMPMMETFWSPYYGMLTDKFGIGWMISIPSPGY